MSYSIQYTTAISERPKALYRHAATGYGYSTIPYCPPVWVCTNGYCARTVPVRLYGTAVAAGQRPKAKAKVSGLILNS
jgi:hypothetical protein